MNRKIYCEGGSDSILIQYLLRKIYGFEFSKRYKRNNERVVVELIHSQLPSLNVEIEAMGGISNLENTLDAYILYLENEDTKFEKSIFIIDNDSTNESCRRLQDILNILDKHNCKYSKVLFNQWISIKINNVYNADAVLELYVIVLPQNREGALELFLLDNLKELDKSHDEEKIIIQCENFINYMSELPEVKHKQYIQKRRELIKAKFNTYFSIATPNEAFQQRQDVLKQVEWEKFDLMKTTFKCFDDLCQ